MSSRTNVYHNLLREVQQGSVTVEAVVNFRKNYNILWTDTIYESTSDTILHIAARTGQANLVEYIIFNWPPHNVNITNKDNKTPLHEASQFSHYKIVEMLLNFGACVNALKKADWTPLMLACTRSGESAYLTVQHLLSCKALLNLVNKDGWTALHVACRTGDLMIVKLLLQYESDVKKRTKNGRTILHIACLHGNFAVASLIFEENFIDIYTFDNYGNTPLHDSACSGNIALLKYFRDKKCNLNILNKAKLSSLHLAAAEGLLNVIKYLIKECGFDPNITSCFSLTPLHYAARRKKSDAYYLLISLGADEYILDVYGRTSRYYFNM